MAWLNGYTTRKKLTVNPALIDSDLTNFPVTIFLTSARHDFTKGNSNGNDVRITSSDGVTLLSYERERHDSTNSLAEYHFKAPSISSTVETDFYFYYRTEATADGADPTNVWDANFKGVWHLKDGTTLSGSDSTSQGHNGTLNGNVAATAGKINGGASFDGNGDYINITRTTAINNLVDGSYTFEVWLKSNSTTLIKRVMGIRDATSGNHLLIFNYPNAGRIRYYAGSGSDVDSLLFNATGLNDNVWRHITAVLDNGTQRGYVNGALDSTRTRVSGTASDTDFRIGDDGVNNSNQMFEGVLDEVRISSVARSAAWIKASYHSGNDSLLTYGPEETLVPTHHSRRKLMLGLG